MEASASANVELGLSLVPAVTLQADNIGGPTLSFVPTAMADVDAGVSWRGSAYCTLNAGVGFDVGLSAKLDLRKPMTGNSLYESLGCGMCWREFEPIELFEARWNIIEDENCLDVLG